MADNQNQTVQVTQTAPVQQVQVPVGGGTAQTTNGNTTSAATVNPVPQTQASAPIQSPVQNSAPQAAMPTQQVATQSPNTNTAVANQTVTNTVPAAATPAQQQVAVTAVKKEESQTEAKKNEKLKVLQDSILAANIPQMVMITISYALDVRTSDIHIEPLENHVRVRYRVDGVLREIVEYPNNLHPAVVSRVKIMSNLKIDEQRLPQDGRADVTTKDGREMDLRISTLPTVNGEKIVMRIQDKSRKIPDLPDLGITGMSLKNLQEALASPNGIIINTGPTGSGKTTTLYSCLMRLNKEDVNILTIEDPVEIAVNGLNQAQVHHDIDFDFASGMRAALRQDPDIIMVGEIRDKETANTAIEASLTGHLVFSTLHTNSAVESLTRIINMGIQPYLLTSTIEIIIAQRLVRKLCPDCKKTAKVDEETLEMVKSALDHLHVEGEVDPALVEKMEFFEAVGCEKCGDVGYHGRVGLYEVFRMNNELRRLILSGASTLDIQEAAQKSGMVTLEQSGIIKALEGKTSLEEVYRVARKGS